LFFTINFEFLFGAPISFSSIRFLQTFLRVGHGVEKIVNYQDKDRLGATEIN